MVVLHGVGGDAARRLGAHRGRRRRDAGVRPGRHARARLVPGGGALVASRRPENAIGWLFCGAGLVFAVATLADGWATYTFADAGEGSVGAAWLSSWLFLPALFGTPQLLFLLFPGGRPLSRRWRWAVWLAAVAIVAQAAGAALAPGELTDAPVDGVANPVAVGSADALEALGWMLGLTSVGLATTSLVLRFRRARGEERLQLKWFVSAAVLFALSCLIAAMIFAFEGDLPAGGQLLILTAFATIPVAAGIAILRHRLYDIDVVINRALVYGALTATLGAAYLALGAADRARGRQVELRHRGVDAGGRRAVPPGARAHPGDRRPALLPPPLRRGADAGGVRRRGCATSSTSSRWAPTCAASSATPSSRPTSRCGCGARDERRGRDGHRAVRRHPRLHAVRGPRRPRARRSRC